jgi:hypothetical protein
MPRFLIASPVRQRPEILREFLRSLAELELGDITVEYAFVDDNDDDAASELLHAFAPGAPVRLMPAGPPGVPYDTDGTAHAWHPSLMERVGIFKDRFLGTCVDEGFDGVFLVDSDLVLHPRTLLELDARAVPICSEIFWTRWEPEDPELPQVWLHGQYSLFPLGRDESIDADESIRRADAFVAQLRQPGLYEVGGLGACTLIRREAVERGASFRMIPNLQLVGEDRDFCVRAAALGIPLHVDTCVPALHLYRAEDLARVPAFRAANAAMAQPEWRKPTGNRIVLSMIVRDEAGRTLAEVLRHAATYVDAAVIIDDGSTDETVAVCHAALGELPHEVISLPESHFAREHELRRIQWQHTMAARPDWILNLDADEIFEDAIRGFVRALVDQTEVDAISFRLFDMWNDTQYRSDGHWYAHTNHRILLARPVPGMAADWPESDQHAGRFPPAVEELAQWTCTVRLKHLGWATEELRRTKHDRYRQLDPEGRWGSAEQYASILDDAPALVEFDG